MPVHATTPRAMSQPGQYDEAETTGADPNGCTPPYASSDQPAAFALLAFGVAARDVVSGPVGRVADRRCAAECMHAAPTVERVAGHRRRRAVRQARDATHALPPAPVRRAAPDRSTPQRRRAAA